LRFRMGVTRGAKDSESCPRGRQVYKRVLKVDASLLTTLLMGRMASPPLTVRYERGCFVRCKYNGLEGELEYETEQIYT